MANLKEIRSRIASVSSTRQITSAMKMVSASKLRKAQDLIIKIRPYASKLQEMLSEVCAYLDNTGENALLKTRDPGKVLLIVLTSNRGMCGAFNSNLVKSALHHAAVNYSEQLSAGNVHFWCFGKKGYDFLKSRKYNIDGYESHIFDNLNFAAASSFAETFASKFVTGEYDRVDILYNKFKNAAVQTITAEQFLPFPINEMPKKKSRKYYLFEPDENEITGTLIPKTLKILLYKALLDSNASEYGARMTAMHKATDNATEMIRELRLTYNKARQAAITNEILEIVSGANALKE